MTARLSSLSALMALLLLQACGTRTTNAVPPRAGNAIPSAMLQKPQSISPALVAAPPMTKTPPQPASAMTSLRRPSSEITPLGFTQLPGAGVFVAASPDGSIWVLSTQGGALDKYIYHYVNGIWTNIPGAAMRLAVGPDNTLWAVNSAGGIYSYKNGAWSTIAGGASEIAVGSDGSVYVISSVSGGQFGNGIWHYVNGVWTQLPGAGVKVAASWDAGSYSYNVAPGGFYIVNAQLSLYYFNPQLGFTQIPGAAVQLAPTTNGGLFVLGVPNSPNGYPIYYNNLATGTWTQQSGAGAAIATNSTNVYVIGAAGGIYQAPVTAPAPSPPPPHAVVEFTIPTQASHPTYITTGPDGALWFTEPGANKIGRVTLAGAFTEYTIPTANSDPQGITTGSDGAVWFAEAYGGMNSKIGRVTTSGVFTEYTAPSAFAQPWGIAAGPDGALWFTESQAAKIGRLTTAGVFAEFPILSGQPTDIVAGPDGALWFTTLSADVKNSNIGRVTTAGAVAEWPLPSTGTLPVGITSGPDGAVWFTENDVPGYTNQPVHNIVRINGSGAFIEYPMGSLGQGSSGITTGPDGALWFMLVDSTDTHLKAGRMTTSGAFNAYLVGPEGFGEQAHIVTGPDGALWFTDSQFNAIGRMSPQ